MFNMTGTPEPEEIEREEDEAREDLEGPEAIDEDSDEEDDDDDEEDEEEDEEVI